MPEPSAGIRWAPRLRPALLKRLYDADASGLRDDELCDDVGLRLYERCRSFVLVHRREVQCPACRTVFTVAGAGESPCPGRGCGWSTTARDYGESLRNHHAHTGRAIGAFSRFHRLYPAARSYAEKIVLIDQLIHSFHQDEDTQSPVKSVASKLLEGNKHEAVRFLDRLSAIDPAVKAHWRSLAARTIDARHLSAGETG